MLVKVMQTIFTLTCFYVNSYRILKDNENSTKQKFSKCYELANMELGRKIQVREGGLLWNRILGEVLSRKQHY